MRPAPGVPIEQQPEGIVVRCTLCGEARGEQDETGSLEAVAMEAVLWVGANRLSSHRFKGATLKDIFLSPWQFSCWNNNDPNRAKMLDWWTLDPISWERADTIADLHERRLLLDPTGGATHYCTMTLWGVDDLDRKPRWHSRQEIEAHRTVERSRIGHHVFAVAP